MCGDYTIELGEVGASYLARLCEDVIVMTDSDFTEEFSHRCIGNCDVLASVQILVAALVIALDDPPRRKPGSESAFEKSPTTLAHERRAAEAV
jgi:hypothetical protein